MVKCARYFVCAWFLIGLSACGLDAGAEDYVIWGEGNMGDELLESGADLLEKAGITYMIDSDSNILIQKKDLNKAAACCS
ncbi:hypothetical protein CR205_03180 [Alteribacter lacisalsi]|uniref:Uncharacterized protein n=1 Tax=Alteribacter lacisalsi TaxID=2045244 RepID=A0A2W0HKI9_9BACI|nr:hypothetical protein [Alteribacter lacisalsi]PYZ97612.1 hypothetical protein CR205_03180 [Alteribacter lacisalsi]